MSRTMTTTRTTTTPHGDAGGIETGDVIELKHEGEWISALVLLASESAVILDACDASTPFVVRRCDLGAFRRFVPDAA